MDLDTPQTPQQFERSLTLFDAVGVVVCAMIGSGIFIVSSETALILHSGGLLLLAWLVAGVMTLVGALCFAELAAGCPEVGGQYTYIKNFWGKLPAFLYGWTLSFVIKSGSIAAVALGFSKFLGLLLPQLGAWEMQLGSLTLSGQKLTAVLLILALTWINSRGIKLVARVQNVISVTNWLALLLITTVGAMASLKSTFFFQNINLVSSVNIWSLGGFVTLGIALVGPLFALDGWNNVTFIAAEIKKPAKNLPLALIWGAGLTTLLYLLVNGAYLSILSLPEIMNAPNGVVGAAFMRAVLGPKGGQLIAAIILVAAFGCVNSMVLSGSRALYALAHDESILTKLSKLGPRSHVPENALWVQAAWSAFLVLTRAFSDLLDYMVFASLLFYGLTVAGLFILRNRTQPAKETTYRVWGYPYLPLLYCLFCGWIMVSLVVLKPVSAGISVVVLMLGLILYKMTSRKKKEISEASAALSPSPMVE
jgi:APA family basic amino acid/polyamine antiporter